MTSHIILTICGQNCDLLQIESVEALISLESELSEGANYLMM